jgi:hypothetical protein
MLHISPPAPTTIARPIIVALAVIAEREGWRVTLPCARSPVPSRARSNAMSTPRAAAKGLTRAGATNTRPSKKSRPPSTTMANWPDSNPASAPRIITAPAIAPARPARRPVWPNPGRSASIGVTRLAPSAGISPARRVTPTPRAMAPASRPGWRATAP